jgi:hypothetical protein
MPTSSKRVVSQHRQQSGLQDDAYDEYVYYPYYSKSVPGGGYEYVQEQQQSYEPQQSREQYYDESAPDNSAPIQRT